MAYINKKEFDALCMAWDYINNILEGCEVSENNIEVIKNLQCTLDGLDSLQRKSFR